VESGIYNLEMKSCDFQPTGHNGVLIKLGGSLYIALQQHMFLTTSVLVPVPEANQYVLSNMIFWIE